MAHSTTQGKDMDEKTGEIRDFKEDEKVPDGFIELGRKPKKNCKHCYGRGYIGWEKFSGNVIPCRCVLKKKE
jgi:hypothetical protein